MKNTIVIDVETTGLDYNNDTIVGFAIKLNDEPTTYHKPYEITQFEKYLTSPDYIKIAYNLKFEYRMLKKHGIQMVPPFYDPLIGIWLLNEGIPYYNGDTVEYKYGLKDLCNKMFGTTMPDFNTMLKQYDHKEPTGILLKNGKPKMKKVAAVIGDVPPEILSSYCINDVDYTYKLYVYTKQKMTDNGLIKLFEKIEMPLIEILVGMEENGMPVSKEKLNELGIEVDKGINEAEIEIRSITDPFGEFNLDSPKMLSDLLYNKLGLPAGKKTKHGQFATGRKAIIGLKHPIIEPILRRKKLSKIKTMFIDTLIDKIKDGHIHTEFVHTGSIAGRLACRTPNLQQIPVQTTEGKKIRYAFIAPPERVLISADYEQMELRILAHFSKEQKLIYAFNHGIDIHRQTASEIFNVPLESVTEQQRSIAKTVNFGLVYGSTEYGLAYSLGIPVEEARSYIRKYFDRFSDVYRWQLTQRVKTRQVGFTTTLFGRKRFIRNINSGDYREQNSAEREALNSPIQGTGADIVKIAMIKTDRVIEGVDCKMIMQVHDELLFDCVDDDVTLNRVVPLIKNTMETAVKISVPLTVSVTVGNNWGEL